MKNSTLGLSRKLLKQNLDNVIFNLDQCGHSQVFKHTVDDILSNFRSPEIFLTFAIQALITYLQKSDPEKLRIQLSHTGLSESDINNLDDKTLSRSEWLGFAERLVYYSLNDAGRFSSPFAIHNDKGWRYWLVHFANNYRARQVFNNVLHENASRQAHYGRSGLFMLAYDVRDRSGQIDLFDNDSRKRAREQLPDDIARLVAASGDTLPMEEFYRRTYNETGAHSEDIHQAMINHPDLSVITDNGGERRSSSAIRIDDTLKLKAQRSLFTLSDLNLDAILTSSPRTK